MKVAIVGFGLEGQSIAKYFENKSAAITVCDIRKKEPGNKKLHGRFGPNYLHGLADFDLIFRSPGVPAFLPEFAGVKEKITSATRYFFKDCPCPIIGITGTKGKGTVSTLIYEMLKKNFEKKGATGMRKVFLGGNIGNCPLDFLEHVTKDDIVILELSSFQLQDMDASPHIAVVLGVTSDHLDYHKDNAEYIEAKRNIVKFQKAGDFVVLDEDNANAKSFGELTKAKKLGFSDKKRVEEGAFVKVGSFILKHGDTGMIFGQKGLTGLIGDHNVKNILAAAVAANLAGAPIEVVSEVVRAFRGLPHRLEFVKEINGVKFYNDSASTNPDTAIAAVRSFSHPLVLIAGGSDKNADFTPLAAEIANSKNIKTVVLMGQTKQKLEAEIEKQCIKFKVAQTRPEPLEIISAESYQEAFMVAKVIAKSGDIVLLSPACASFDMFTDYRERGDIFRNFVLDMSIDI